jgi:glycerophosphoryl diester phosphodiesterase
MTLNIAHRGARSLAPENTILAAHKGFLTGADLWETDVTVTRDETLILMHDDTLARTTDAVHKFPDRDPWNVATFSLAGIRTLDAGSWFTATDPFGQVAARAIDAQASALIEKAKVPTLEEALLFTKDNKWIVNLELKPIPPPMNQYPVVEQVLHLIETVELDRQQVIISSFHHPWLHEVKARTSKVAVQALVGWGNREALDGRDLKFDVYNLSRQLADKDRIEWLLRLGKQVNVYTVNEEAEMRQLIAAGVHGIFTDFPQRLAQVLKSM